MSYRVSYRNNRNCYGYRNYKEVESPLFKSLKDIELVLNELKNSIDQNGWATLKDFYKLTNAVVVKEEDSNYGWNDLLNIQIINTRYGYLLDMTTPLRITHDPIRDAITVLQESDENYLPNAVDEACNILRDITK